MDVVIVIRRRVGRAGYRGEVLCKGEQVALLHEVAVPQDINTVSSNLADSGTIYLPSVTDFFQAELVRGSSLGSSSSVVQCSCQACRFFAVTG